MLFRSLLVSLFKIGGFLLCLSTVAPMTDVVSSWSTLYDDFIRAFEFNEYTISFSNQEPVFQEDELIRGDKLWKSPALVLLVQILCSWILYTLSKFSCCADIQKSCFASPISLAMPICVLALGLMCKQDRKSTRLNSSHSQQSRMPSSA